MKSISKQFVMGLFYSAVLFTSLMALCGCSTANLLPKSAEAAPQPEERKEQLVQDYERKRDAILLQSALARWEANDLPAARDELIRLLDRSPDNAEARLLLSDVYVALGDRLAADSHVQHVLQQNPDNPQALRALGELKFASGEVAEAKALLTSAIQLAPNDPAIAASYSSLVAPRP